MLPPRRARGHPYYLLFIHLFHCHTLNPSLSAGRESVVSRDQPISPRYTPCILISRIGSALPHRVNSQQTHSVDYVVYSRSHAFHDGNQILRRKNPNTTGIEPSFFPPRGGRRTSTLPGLSYTQQILFDGDPFSIGRMPAVCVSKTIEDVPLSDRLCRCCARALTKNHHLSMNSGRI